METQIDLTEPPRGRITAWIISILSSLLAVGSLAAHRGDFARIEGLDAVNLAQIAPEGIPWFAGFLIAAVVCVLPALRGLQTACGSLAYGMLVFVLIDQGSQFRQFQEMGLVPESLMGHVKIPWPGWLMAATMAGFLIVILAETVLRIVCRRK